MKKLITFLIACFAITNLYSQSDDIAYPHIIPMTPNAAQLAKYTDHPVSYYTGTANINIPLYEINVGDFKLPISLNYHPSGIRVDQEATWVGLGWSLDVGSRISRSVKGTDDFLMGRDSNYPYCIQGYYDAPDITSNLDNHYNMLGVQGCETFVELSHNLIYDPEPDIFYYNLPNLNGKFILDKSRGAVLFDKSHNLKIEIIRNSNSMVGFKITDSEGNQYFYNQWEFSKNYASNGWLNKNIHSYNTVYDSDYDSFIEWSRIRFPDCSEDWSPGNQNPYSMVTSWCLSKIITKQFREINFSYDSETQYLPTQEACEAYNYQNQNSVFYNKSKVVNYGLRLSAIYGDFGRVEFGCTSRYDIKGDGKKLVSITVKNKGNELIKDYRFTYEYFNEDYSGLYENVFKRLKLTNLKEYSAANEPLNAGHSFHYYEGSFPAKNSKNVDYWGFQNGKNYGQNYHIGVYLPNNIKLPGVKKDADFQKAVIGTIKTITYPLGGVEEFTYESNTIPSGYFETHTADEASSTATVNVPVYNNYILNEYPDNPSNQTYSFELQGRTIVKIRCRLENVWGQRDPSYNYYNFNYPLGKLRRTGSSPQTYYTYECPFVYSSSIYQGEGSEITLVERSFTLEAGTYEFEAYTPPKDVLADWQLYMDYQYRPIINSNTPMTLYNGGGIRIKEIKNEAKIRKFKYPAGLLLCEPVLYYHGRRAGIPDYIAACVVQVSESKSPLSTFNNGNIIGYDWVEEYMVDEDDNVAKTRYNFYNDTESDAFNDNFPESPRYINYKNGLVKSIEKYKNATLVARDDFSYNSTFSNTIKAFKDRGQKRLTDDVLPYLYQVEWPLKSLGIHTLRTDNGQDVVAETNYNYNSKNLLSSTRFNLGQSEIVEELKYPFDFSDPVNFSMEISNMVSTPILKETFKDGIKTSTSQTVYKDWGNGLIAPEIVKTSNGSGLPEDRLKYNAYDSNGNLLEVQQENGLKVSYIWGYKRTQPVAKLENIAYLDIPVNLIIAIQNATDSTVPNQALVISALTALRDSNDPHMQKAFITTITFKPLVGMVSQTDAKGMTTYYEYDDFQRLLNIKDHNGDIVKNYKYNYRQEAGSGVYNNTAITQSFQKNNCPIGQTGSTESYTVHANTYSASTPEEAQALAVADMSANGQKYANDNGTCNGLQQVSLSRIYQKNNCPSGQTGSMVTYNVTKYASTLQAAQADAEADTAVNGQTYANTIGTCSGEPPMYGNRDTTATFQKNNCPSGQTGSNVSYTLPADTFSEVTQFKADSAAAANMPGLGQAYANANGTCNGETVFYNVEKYQYFARQDCAEGKIAFQIAYTVAAGTYSASTQIAADALATADIAANGQTYANTYGQCLDPEPSVFYNAVMSKTFRKNDCGPGYVGSLVTYTVPANMYSSSAQYGADILAANNIAALGQGYANTHGTCTPADPGVYYSVAMSQSFQKNNCGSGGTGSSATYSVPAGLYSASSQSAADAIAAADLAANGQSYTNTVGWCNSTVYYNALLTQNFQKNDCPSGQTGSVVPLTIPANAYSASSQAAADALAANAMATYGQDYANSTGTCLTGLVYYNTFVSHTFQKDNCPSGQMGSHVTYVVPVGTFPASSQYDADMLAINDIAMNGQAYANANGTCGTPYYNATVSQSFQRNNCPSGQNGSTVTYTVPAGTYTALSQSAANSMAAADVMTNGQTYANNNGICSSEILYYNIDLNLPFWKDDCDPGYVGSAVMFPAAAGMFSAGTQAAANSLASAYIYANGQANANANGTCIYTGEYFNTVLNQSFQKNNCTSGTGAHVIYTVPARTYSSEISQADADAQAAADATANGQAYANSIGDCNGGVKYAKVVISNESITDEMHLTPASYQKIADVSVNLYSDAACTIPFTTTTDMYVHVIYTVIANGTNYPGGYSEPQDMYVPIEANTSGLSLGTFPVPLVYNYYDTNEFLEVTVTFEVKPAPLGLPSYTPVN